MTVLNTPHTIHVSSESNDLQASMRVACTVVRTDTGSRESFHENVGVHQRYVLSPLLFAVVMDIDVIYRGTRNEKVFIMRID